MHEKTRVFNRATEDVDFRRMTSLPEIPELPPVYSIKNALISKSGKYERRALNGVGGPFQPKHSGAVYGPEGDLVSRILLRRKNGTVANFDVPRADPNNFDGAIHLTRAVYLGWYFCHHGHFLIESLSRFWALRHLYEPGMKLLFHVPEADRELGVSDTHFRVFEAFSVRPEDIVLARDHYRVDLLIAPEQAATLDTSTHQVMNAVYERISESILGDYAGPTPEKLYVSRARLPHFKKKSVNEEETEAVFRQHGFEILHPEEMTLFDQIAAFRGATLIAGCPGSGIHATVFNKRHATVLALAKILGPYIPEHQFILNRLAGCESIFVHCLIPVESWKLYWADNRIIDALLCQLGTPDAVPRTVRWSPAGALPRMERHILEEHAKYATIASQSDVYDPILRRLVAYCESREEALKLISAFWEGTRGETDEAKLAHALRDIIAWLLGLYWFETEAERDILAQVEISNSPSLKFFTPTFSQITSALR
jgi:hypothetical protein